MDDSFIDVPNVDETGMKFQKSFTEFHQQMHRTFRFLFTASDTWKQLTIESDNQRKALMNLAEQLSVVDSTDFTRTPFAEFDNMKSYLRLKILESMEDHVNGIMNSVKQKDGLWKKLSQQRTDLNALLTSLEQDQLPEMMTATTTIPSYSYMLQSLQHIDQMMNMETCILDYHCSNLSPGSANSLVSSLNALKRPAKVESAISDLRSYLQFFMDEESPS